MQKPWHLCWLTSPNTGKKNKSYVPAYNEISARKESVAEFFAGGISMRIFHTRKQLIAFFMPGFLFGIVYVNFIAVRYMAEPGLFSTYFLEQYQSVDIIAGEYLWYLIRTRIFPLIILAGFSVTRLRKAASVLFLIWTGMSGGILISLAAADLGIKGSILCITGLLPQFLFYIPAYLILLWYAYAYPASRWNRQKTIFISFMMAAGLVLEVYVNPVLVRIFLSVL